MWILHFLSDDMLAFLVNAILIAGVIGTVIFGFFLKHIIRLLPMLSAQIRVFQIASIVLLVVGVYLKGAHMTELEWRARVKEVEERMKVAEEKSKEENAKLEKKLSEKRVQIQQKTVVVKQFIDREVTKYNDQCKIPEVFVKAHNDAAEHVTSEKQDKKK